MFAQCTDCGAHEGFLSTADRKPSYAPQSVHASGASSHFIASDVFPICLQSAKIVLSGAPKLAQ